MITTYQQRTNKIAKLRNVNIKDKHNLTFLYSHSNCMPNFQGKSFERMPLYIKKKYAIISTKIFLFYFVSIGIISGVVQVALEIIFQALNSAIISLYGKSF